DHDVGIFTRRAAGHLDVISEPDAVQPAALFRLAAAARKTFPVGEREHPLHDPLVVAAVIGHPAGNGGGPRRRRHTSLAPERGAGRRSLWRGSGTRPRPARCAGRPTSRSIANIASGRPALRYGLVGAVVDSTARTRMCATGMR